MELPLARCGTDPLWHWAATCSHPVGHARTDLSYWTTHFDHVHDHDHVGDTREASTVRGRYRSHHRPLLVTIAAAVTWDAVGDLNRIRSMVEPLLTIGKKRSSGHGYVTAWEVQPTEVDPWTAGHRHPDSQLGRTTPTRCHDALVSDAAIAVGTAGLRPPYSHPAHQHELALPAPVAGSPR